MVRVRASCHTLQLWIGGCLPPHTELAWSAIKNDFFFFPAECSSKKSGEAANENARSRAQKSLVARRNAGSVLVFVQATETGF